MRTRKRGYELKEGLTVDEVIESARKGDSEAEMALYCAAMVTYPELAEDLYESIRKNLSYDYMDRYMHPIHINKGSFYAYRRKTLSIYAIMMNL